MARCGELVGSILGGTNLNYIFHITCIRKAITAASKERDMVDLGIWKEEVGVQESNFIHR